jgi:hypothetical protein
MSSFGISKHAHVEAGLLAVFLTLLTYGFKWVFGLRFPGSIFVLPTFIGVFIGFYAILFVALFIVWSRD